MKTLEKGQDRIDKIGKRLREEVLEPAKAEAEEIIIDAKARAEGLVEEARTQASQLLAAARAEIEKERNVLKSSLLQAAAQSLESLRQSVENKLFNQELTDIIEKATVSTDVIANLIKAVVTAIENEGIDVELEVLIPKSVSAREVNLLVGEKMLKRLKGKSVELGTIVGGVQVKLVGKHMMIDISSEVLQELLAEYLRKDYRQLIFAASN